MLAEKLKGPIRNLLMAYPQRVLRREFEHQRFTRFNERPVEFRFVFKCLTELYPQRVLDVGTGTTCLPHLMRSCGCVVTAIDNIQDYWPSGMVNRHYHILDEDISSTSLQGPFDLITCISVLEHIADYQAAVANMLRLLAPGGHLVATFPYTDSSYIPNVYKRPESSYTEDLPYICQSYSRDTVVACMLDHGGEVVEQEYWQLWDGEFWTAGERVIPPRRVEVNQRHQLSCLLVKKSG